MVVLLAAVPYGTVDAWWEAACECSVFGVTAIWLVKVLLRGSWDVQKLLILVPLVFLTGFAFAQTLVWPTQWFPIRWLSASHTLTIDPFQTLLTARKMLAVVSFLGLLLLHTSSPRRLRWLVR